MEMDAETKRDNVWLAPFIEFCNPTAAQVAQLPSCIFAPESEDYKDSNRDQPSPSPSPSQSQSQSQALVLFMVSPPGTLASFDNDEGAVFLTPPEHHSHSQLSSSEDQNPNELRAEAERAAKRARIEIVESEGAVDETEIITGDSNGEERAASVPAQGGGGDELGKKVKEIEELRAEAERTAKRARIEIVETEGAVDETEIITGDSNGEAKAAPVLKQGGGGDELGKKVKEIEEFRYVGEAERRRLPPSLKGKGEVKEKDVVESSEKKKTSALLGLLDVLVAVLRDADNGSDEEVDFLETAKRRGMKFPRPRWWPDDYP